MKNKELLEKMLTGSVERLKCELSWPERLALRKFLREKHLSQIFLTSGKQKEELEISERDRQVALSVIQWLGTNIGQCFIKELFEEVRERGKRIFLVNWKRGKRKRVA